MTGLLCCGFRFKVVNIEASDKVTEFQIINRRGDNGLKLLIGKLKILNKKIKSLKQKMKSHAENLEFEEAVKIRDEIKR